MPTEGTDNNSNEAPLLADDEPTPYVVRNAESVAPVLLVCDHASRRFPKSLGTMGLDPFARRCHLALDIGAGALTEAIASALGATAVLCQYSRLIVDCNRQLMDPGAFLEFGDGVVIPGNRKLRREDRERRADAIYWPYHAAIEGQINRLRDAGVTPVFVSIHSFTPVLNGESRTWEMGILWDQDRPTAELFVNGLRDAGYLVGDNEPYSGKAPQDFTIDHHAEPIRLPHVGVEIRQDLIHHDDGVERIAKVLGKVVAAAAARAADAHCYPEERVMTHNEPEFTIGVEEEYLLVDKESRGLVVDPPQSLLSECEDLLGGQVTNELLRSQIEVGTKVCRNVQEAREDLARLRRCVIEVTGRHGIAPIAASTHPFSLWSEQKHTQKDRYESLTAEMQAAARRLVICGMHVHVGINDDALRIDLMNQAAYFLPHLLALSCSSPFWRGFDTGLKSYRLTVFDALPRTGLPESFQSYAEYRRHVDILINAGVIEDSSKIWWDMRPSARFPTLETRIMDVCTRLDDAIALAALLVCLMRMLYRLRLNNQRWRTYSRMLVRENRWRAMRYSFDEGLIDFAKGRIVPFDQLLDDILELTYEDARALDCETEVASVRDIMSRGTSAHRQLKVHELSLAAGDSAEDALKAVVDTLINDTSDDL